MKKNKVWIVKSVMFAYSIRVLLRDNSIESICIPVLENVESLDYYTPLKKFYHLFRSYLSAYGFDLNNVIDYTVHHFNVYDLCGNILETVFCEDFLKCK